MYVNIDVCIHSVLLLSYLIEGGHKNIVAVEVL